MERKSSRCSPTPANSFLMRKTRNLVEVCLGFEPDNLSGSWVHFFDGRSGEQIITVDAPSLSLKVALMGQEVLIAARYATADRWTNIAPCAAPALVISHFEDVGKDVGLGNIKVLKE